jgi:hypothetical protein
VEQNGTVAICGPPNGLDQADWTVAGDENAGTGTAHPAASTPTTAIAISVP